MKYRIGDSSVFKERAGAVDIFMDGHIMRESVLLPQDTEGTVWGARTSDSGARPFMFADVQMTGTDYLPFPSIRPYSVYILHSWIIQMKAQCPAMSARIPTK